MIELKTCDVSTDEQETTISFGRKDGRAYVYCNDSVMLTKLEKILNAEGSEWRLEETVYTKSKTVADYGIAGYKLSCPKGLIKFSAKKKAVSEEQREALRERMRNYHASLGNEEEEDAEENDE